MKNIGMIFIMVGLSWVLNAQRKSCLIQTSLGDIHLELYPEAAPLTVANFLYYVDGHHFDSSTFFRVTTLSNEAHRDVKIEVIQGGNVPKEKQKDPIRLETTKETGIEHLDGTISMARSKPHTATTSFFICINDQPSLNFGGARNPDGQGFAAFGRVTKGMAVVRKIQSGENEQQRLKKPVTILKIRRK